MTVESLQELLRRIQRNRGRHEAQSNPAARDSAAALPHTPGVTSVSGQSPTAMPSEGAAAAVPPPAVSEATAGVAPQDRASINMAGATMPTQAGRTMSPNSSDLLSAMKIPPQRKVEASLRVDPAQAPPHSGQGANPGEGRSRSLTPQAMVLDLTTDGKLTELPPELLDEEPPTVVTTGQAVKRSSVVPPSEPIAAVVVSDETDREPQTFGFVELVRRSARVPRKS